MKWSTWKALAPVRIVPPLVFDWKHAYFGCIELKPGRPTCLIEVKKTGSLRLEEVLEQALGYARTIIGRHAGLEALPIVMLSGDSFYFAVVYWENFAILKIGLCTKCFKLTGYIFLSNYWTHMRHLEKK